MRDVLERMGLVALFLGAILLNDVLFERRVAYFLSTHPEIISNAIAHVEADRGAASARLMQQHLIEHWDALALTRAYAVRFDGTKFQSRLVHIGEVANPTTINLIATDYRCGYCKADRSAVDALLKAKPNRDFVFLEAAILGDDSVELAKAALLRAQKGEADYYVIHNRQFDAPTKSSSERGDNADVAIYAEQKRFLDIVGVSATPTYIRDGVFRSGTIASPDG